MKNIILSLAALLCSVAAAAQPKTCSTMWPYLYPEFTEGTIYMTGGQKVIQKVNIHTQKGSLHFIDDKGVVKEAVLKEVLVLEVGEEKYMCVNGSMMKVVASEDRGFVAASILGDFQKLSDKGGAYGTSTTNSSTQKVTSIDIAGAVNQNHMELWNNRQNGETVDLVTKYYLVTPDGPVPANKKDVETVIGSSRASEFKAWLKSNKIKWNDPQSLVTLLDFICKK